MLAVNLQRTARRAVPTILEAADALSLVGLRAALGEGEEVDLVAEPDEAVTAVVAVTRVDDVAVLRVQALRRRHLLRVVLVVDEVDDDGLLAIAQGGVSGLLLRRDTTPDRLREAVVAAAEGDGTMSPAMLGQLLTAFTRAGSEPSRHPAAPLVGITDREVEVLRLLADGCGTAEIANRLAYSERTIKSVVRQVVSRLNLRNRTQAVAYAVRAGLI